MSSKTEINSDHVRSWERWKKTAIEWLAVVIACTSMVISVVSMFVTAVAVATVIAMDNRIDGLESSIDVYRIRAAKLNAYLAARGIDTEEIYDD